MATKKAVPRKRRKVHIYNPPRIVGREIVIVESPNPSDVEQEVNRLLASGNRYTYTTSDAPRGVEYELSEAKMCAPSTSFAIVLEKITWERRTLKKGTKSK